MNITDETIDYVAALAKLKIKEEDRERTKKDLSDILGYMDRMNELDTDGIEPMSHAFPMKNVFREDVVTNTDDSENLLSNAPKKKENQFMVPKTVDE